MRRQVFRSLRRLVEQLASQRPLVLVLEDLHWIDHSSAELLEHLLPLVTSCQLLICGVSRPERASFAAHLRQVAATQYQAQYQEVLLAPLSTAASDELV